MKNMKEIIRVISTYIALLARKFADRKLFTPGLLCLKSDGKFGEEDGWLENTDLVYVTVATRLF